MNKQEQIKRALISVSDKEGIVEFARQLVDMDVEIISTGGTAGLLSDGGVRVTKVADVTGSPEILGGRVKTLHPKIHGGILAMRDNDEHKQQMQNNGITGIDMLVINLYPFEKTVESGADFDECVEQIDIGGPAMMRASAKNHKFVTIITDTADCERVLGEMRENDGATTVALRRKLAQKAYARTARYDTVISEWFARQL